MNTENIKQITIEDLEKAVGDLKKSTHKSVQIAVVYLEKELRRRKNSGRPATSKLSRKEQVNQAVRRHRSKQTHTSETKSD